MLSLKENYLIAMNHGIPEQVPIYSKPVRYNVGLGDEFEKGPSTGGLDGFGCLWSVEAGGATPVPGNYVLTDITDWKNQVHFPDLTAIDWESKAEKELAALDRENQVMEYGMGNGPFERFLDLMGLEELTYALMDEPEACKEFLKAFTEYRINYVEIIAKHYKPDYVVTFDDVAYANGLFLSKEQYCEFIQPVHKAVNDVIREHGALPIQHCCGLAAPLVEEFIKEGAVAWSSVDPANDVVGVLEKYAKQITLIGGYDSFGAAATLEATDEMMINEVHRVMDTYAPYGSFIMGNHIVQGNTPEETMRRIQLLREEGLRYGADFYKNRM